MDYYGQTCLHKDISSIKIVKYLLLCTLTLLLLGLVTLASRVLVAFSHNQSTAETDTKSDSIPCHSIGEFNSQLSVEKMIFFIGYFTYRTMSLLPFDGLLCCFSHY